jgi:transposase
VPSIDRAQAAPGLLLFCAVLAFSPWRIVTLTSDQKASTTLALIAEAFGAIGGVAARVLADRDGLPQGWRGRQRGHPSAEHVRLAGHYRVTPDFCHANDPQSKGIVEKLCGYAQPDLAVPLLTEAAITGTPVDLRAANVKARAWCAEVNAALHFGDLRSTRRASDRRTRLLQPLPSLLP